MQLFVTIKTMSLIDEYLANVQQPQKDELERIRALIKSHVPDAKEVITYGMPGFKYSNKYLIAYAPFKNHLSIFPGAAAIDALSGKLKDYSVSKGTIQFTVTDPLPDMLIKEILGIRLNQIRNS
jgi:uncharacterized protein YdhG (YjbR/CyaY superfamily)